LRERVVAHRAASGARELAAPPACPLDEGERQSARARSTVGARRAEVQKPVTSPDPMIQWVVSQFESAQKNCPCVDSHKRGSLRQ